MFKFALAALLCAQALARPEIESHIVGGNEAKEGQFPFAVTVRRGPKGLICGGALISDRYVVTSASSLLKHNTFQVGVGSINVNSQKLYDVEKVIAHPEYDDSLVNNDIALLKLKTPVKLGKNIQTINFPVKENLDGKTVTAMGWGRTSANGRPSDVLMYISRPVMTKEQCKNGIGYEIFDTQICMNVEFNAGFCYGDSGSPMLYKGADGKNYIAGVASWGVPCGKGFPDVYTRISYFAKWIKENMA